MGTKIQEYMASFDLSRAFRQFQKAEKAFNNDQTDSAVNHLEKGLNLVAKSIDHIIMQLMMHLKMPPASSKKVTPEKY
jgi:hypothetical protein